MRNPFFIDSGNSVLTELYKCLYKLLMVAKMRHWVSMQVPAIVNLRMYRKRRLEKRNIDMFPNLIIKKKQQSISRNLTAE